MRHCLATLTGRPEPLVFLEPASMVCQLPGYRDWMSGTLVYPDPFWRLDCVGLRDSVGPAPKRPQVASDAPKMRTIWQRGDV